MSILKPNSEPGNTIPKETEIITPELETKLKASDPDVQQHIRDLKTEIRQLHKKNLKIQATNVTLKLRIDVLEEHYRECSECELDLIKRTEEKVNKSHD